MSAPRIDSLLAPQRVAIIGGLSKPTGLGRRTLTHLQDAGFGGEIIQASCAADADGADVAIVAVPAAAAHEVVAELDGQVSHAIVYSSGFEEAGAAALPTLSPRTRLLGPNAVGLYYAPSRAVLTFATAFDDLTDCAHGSGIVLISQSGAFGARLVRAARHYGLHLDGFIGTGNETSYDAAQLAADLIASPAHRPRVLALYLESVRDAAGLAHALEAARAVGVPVVVLYGGRSASGAQAAQSHTAAVTGDASTLRELCLAAGAHLVAGDREMVDALIGLSICGRAAGRRVGVITGSGGAGVVAADLLTDVGLVLPAPTAATRAALTELLPAYASVHNPIDVTAQVIGDTPAVSEICRRIANSGEVDALLVVARADQARQISASAGSLPVITVVLDGATHTVSSHIADGVAVLPSLSAGCAAITAVCATADEPLDVDDRAGARWPRSTPDQVPSWLAAGDVASSLRALDEAQVAAAPWERARTPQQAREAAERLGWPVVLKSNGDALAHKAAAGMLALDVTPHSIERRIADIFAISDDVVVASQLRAGPELFIGVRRDAMFGRVIAAGLGGGNVELIDRVISVPESVAPARLRRRLAEIFHRPGTEHLPGLITEAAMRLYALATRYDLDLVECNPLVEINNQLTALDARAIKHVND